MFDEDHAAGTEPDPGVGDPESQDGSMTAFPARGSALQHLRHRFLGLAKGRVIYDECDRADAFYCVESGCVRLLAYCDDGRRQILAFCLPGDMFGIRLSGQQTCAAETTIASVVKRFPIDAITAETVDRQELVDLVAMAAEMNANLSLHLKGLGHASAEARLIWFLDWLADRQGVASRGGIVRPPMSRRDIADFLGFTPETLSRTFARLRERGHVQVYSDKQLMLRPQMAHVADARWTLPNAA